jgi:hypothetical protein
MAVMPDVAETTSPEDLIIDVVAAYVKKKACIVGMHGACEGNPVGERARSVRVLLCPPLPKNNSTRLPACVFGLCQRKQRVANHHSPL